MGTPFFVPASWLPLTVYVDPKSDAELASRAEREGLTKAQLMHRLIVAGLANTPSSDYAGYRHTDGELNARFLRWRHVEDACLKCFGSGIRTYGSTATWRGRIGGATITSDVCDVCWGSGDKYRSGTDLKKLRNEEGTRIAEQAVDALARSAGATLNTSLMDVMHIVEVLRAAGNKRGKGVWFKPLCDSLANLLERAVKKTNGEGKADS